MTEVQEINWRGDRMRALREAQGWSLFDLAVRVNSKPGTLQRYEKGRMPPVPMLMALHRVFGVSLEYLLDQSDDPSPYKNNGLSPDWREAVEQLIELRYGPKEAVQALRSLRSILDGGQIPD